MYFCSHVSPFFVHLIQIEFNLLLVSGNVEDNQSMNFGDPRVNQLFFFFFPFFRKLVATTVSLPWVLKQRRPTFWRKTFWIRNKHLFESQANATFHIFFTVPVILILLLFAYHHNKNYQLKLTFCVPLWAACLSPEVPACQAENLWSIPNQPKYAMWL